MPKKHSKKNSHGKSGRGGSGSGRGGGSSSQTGGGSGRGGSSSGRGGGNSGRGGGSGRGGSSGRGGGSSSRAPDPPRSSVDSNGSDDGYGYGYGYGDDGGGGGGGGYAPPGRYASASIYAPTSSMPAYAPLPDHTRTGGHRIPEGFPVHTTYGGSGAYPAPPPSAHPRGSGGSGRAGSQQQRPRQVSYPYRPARDPGAGPSAAPAHPGPREPVRCANYYFGCDELVATPGSLCHSCTMAGR